MIVRRLFTWVLIHRIVVQNLLNIWFWTFKNNLIRCTMCYQSKGIGFINYDSSILVPSPQYVLDQRPLFINSKFAKIYPVILVNSRRKFQCRMISICLHLNGSEYLQRSTHFLKSKVHSKRRISKGFSKENMIPQHVLM